MLGSVRTYAYVGPQLDARRWIEAVGEGRSFMTNGPLVELRINQRMPGEEIHFPPEGGNLEVECSVWSIFPLTRAVIHHNGKVWKELPLNPDRLSATFRTSAKIADSGWFSLAVEGERVAGSSDPSYPQAVSNPIRVYVGDRKIRSKESAQYFITWIDKLRKMAEAHPGWRSESEKAKVFTHFEKAKAVYTQRAAEAAH